MSKSSAKKPLPPFIVYVKYTGSGKEYAYYCDFPVVPGGQVIANGQTVSVVRTAGEDSRATKWVMPHPSSGFASPAARLDEIRDRLNEIEREMKITARLAVLAKFSPEARRLVAEYRKLHGK